MLPRPPDDLPTPQSDPEHNGGWLPSAAGALTVPIAFSSR